MQRTKLIEFEDALREMPTIYIYIQYVYKKSQKGKKVRD